MSRSGDERIADILDAADELAAIGAAVEALRWDAILRRAAERLLEIDLTPVADRAAGRRSAGQPCRTALEPQRARALDLRGVVEAALAPERSSICPPRAARQKAHSRSATAS